MTENKEKQNKLKPIKTIAGEVFLYLYWLQRQDAGDLKNTILSFTMFPFKRGEKLQHLVGVQLERKEDSIFNVEHFSPYSDNDLYNSLVYLYDSNLLFYTDSRENTRSNFLNFKLTASGIDLIEGIERGKEEQKQFNVTFNFNVHNNVTVESLLKANFGSLVKASVF